MVRQQIISDNTRKEVRSLYVLKAFCAFFVICLHYLFIGRNVVLPIIKIAVPCFFLISGYFLVDSQGVIATSRVKKQFKKLLKLTVAINIVYFVVVSLYTRHLLLEIFEPVVLLRLCLYGDVLGDHLWFLTAYVEVLLLLLLLMRLVEKDIRVSLKWLPIIMTFLLTALIFGKYSFLFGHNFEEYWFRNALNIAMPFMYFGAMVRVKENVIITRINRTTLLALLLVMCLLSYSEYGIQSLICDKVGQGDLNLFTILLALLVFMMCIHFKENKLGRWDWFVTIGRDHSNIIYLFHMMFLLLIPSSLFGEGNPLMLIAVWVLSLALSFIIKKISFLV